MSRCPRSQQSAGTVGITYCHGGVMVTYDTSITV